MIKTYRDSHPDRPIVYLDAGRAYPMKTQETDVIVPFMIRSFGMLGLDAINVGEDDLTGGLSPYRAIAGSGEHVTVNANLVSIDTGEPCFTPYAVITPRLGSGRAASPRIAVIGLTQPDRYRVIDGAAGDKFHFVDINRTLDKWLPKARAEADLVAVIGNFGIGTARGLAGHYADLDLVICTVEHSDAVTTMEYRNTFVVQTGSLGKRDVRLELFKESGPRRWRVVPYVTALGDSIPVNREASDLMESFRVELESRARRRAEGTRHDPGAPDYAGATACTPCHAEAARAWQSSAHSRAWATLQRTGNTLNPLCLQCHTVAYLKPNGFVWDATHPHLVNVGCEACHGPGAAHVKNPRGEKLGPAGEATCKGCHTPGQTPDFDFATYWPRIAHK